MGRTFDDADRQKGEIQRRPAQKEKEKEKDAECMNVLVANVTVWGPTVDKFFREKAMEFDAVGVSEHHLMGKKLKDTRAKLEEAGWRTTWSQARPSRRSAEGTTGGTAWIRPACYCTTEFLQLSGGGSAAAKDMVDITVMMWRAKGQTIALIVIYLDDSGAESNKCRKANNLGANCEDAHSAVGDCWRLEC